MQTVAVVTMVRDDAFFLKAWLHHYGEMFGRENCYIVNHGRGAGVAALATGCNIIGIPGDPHKNFDVKRWGFLNGIVGGLRRYYRHVIVGDVDELVIRDPDADGTLLDFLQDAPKGRVLTPWGLEVIHRIDIENEAIDDHILGPAAMCVRHRIIQSPVFCRRRSRSRAVVILHNPTNSLRLTIFI